jgi:hypothetical protein
MTASIAGHELAVGDVVVDEDGLRWRLLGRWWDGDAWEARRVDTYHWGLIADDALNATGDNRCWWWDS